MVEEDFESKTEPLLPQDMKEGIVEADIESKMEPLLPTDVRSIMVEANIESKTEPLLSSAVEKEDMSWRINLEESLNCLKDWMLNMAPSFYAFFVHQVSLLHNHKSLCL